MHFTDNIFIYFISPIEFWMQRLYMYILLFGIAHFTSVIRRNEWDKLTIFFIHLPFTYRIIMLLGGKETKCSATYIYRLVYTTCYFHGQTLLKWVHLLCSLTISLLLTETSVEIELSQ